MGTFRYRAYGVDGAFAEGVIEAASETAATEMLWSRGLTPFEMRAAAQAGAKWWQRDLISSGGSQLKDLASFTREFATLNAAEVPLDDALRILRAQASSPRVRTIVEGLLSDVLNGATLSDAMQKQPQAFPADYISMVRAGEIGATDGQAFLDLADLLEQRVEISARIQSALVYPCILVLLSIGTVACLAGGLIPSIAPIFAESGKPMPTAVWLLMFLQMHWIEIAAGGLAGTATVVLGVSVALKRPAVRLAMDRYKLKVPLLGPFVLHQETARLARTLGTMLKVGVPLLQAAAGTRDVVRNTHLGQGLDRTIEAVQRGVSLHRALQSETPLPAVALQMISVGEEAGKLDRMLIRIAVMFERQTQSSIEKFMAALTPILTVGIAGLVGALVIPIMGAVLSINDLVTR